MSDKKILDKSPVSGIAVPIAIVLVGALIIFGVTKMLSTGKSHRDLVDELHSKTFGNRWVAAYELSRYLASSRIPKEDVPWVSENLIEVYKHSEDARTRNFIILALGLLNYPPSYEVLGQAVDDSDPQVRFNAVVAMGNLPDGVAIDWTKLETLLNTSEDEGLKQAILTIIAARHKPDGDQLLLPFLQNSARMLRYSAAMGLIYYGKEDVRSTLEEIMSLSYDLRDPTQLNGAQVEALKVNVLTHIEKARAKFLLGLAQTTSEKDSNIKVSTKAKEVVNLLKN